MAYSSSKNLHLSPKIRYSGRMLTGYTPWKNFNLAPKIPYSFGSSYSMLKTFNIYLLVIKHEILPSQNGNWLYLLEKFDILLECSYVKALQNEHFCYETR